MDEEVPTIVERGFRCRACDRPYRHQIEVNVSIERAVASMMRITCPHCGADAKKASIGESLTLAEDVERRIPDAPIDQRVLNWQKFGETGMSSEAILAHMTGAQEPKYGYTPPSDMDDFRRCVLLLGHVPEWQDRMPEMASHPGWKDLAPAFRDIANAYLREAPNLQGRAPEASVLFSSVLGERP